MSYKTKRVPVLLLLTILFSFAVKAQIKEECLSGNCVNGKGIKKYANGAAYDGEFLDSLRNGFGVMVWQSGDKYIGDWKAGLISGKGTMFYKDGSKYIGDWIADKCNGKGRLELKKNNCVYEGDFVNNLWEGKGTLEWIEGSEWKGDKYIGDFKKGQRTGKGKYISANGTIQVGDFENGNFMDPLKKPFGCVSGDCENGVGTFNFNSDKVTYTGQFKNGMTYGEGTYKNLDGIYKGHIFREERDGFGTLTYNNGYSYTGIWKYNKITYGTFNNGKGTTYTGQLKESLSGRIEFDGEGTEISGEYMGRTTKGYWKAGKLTGKAVQIYPNGYYVKAVFNDYPSSNDEYFDNQNNKITWEEFKAKTPRPICSAGNCFNGIGICELNLSNHYYIGQWVNGKKEGFVAEFESATNYYYGIWKADTLVKKISDKEAEKYLIANPKEYLYLLKFDKSFAAAFSLLENCTTKTCTSGDCKNGFGTEVDCKGNTYSGNWVNGQMTGKGKFTSSDGNVYEGNLKNGKVDGKGIYRWANGNVYDGDWVNNVRQGKGKFTWANGDVYNGDWVNGIQQGKGEMTWQRKEYYIGDWVNGIRQGKGRSRDTENRIKEGDWVNDKFIISQAQRDLNEELRYKIKRLKDELEISRKSYLNAVRPNNEKDIERYERARASVLADIKYMESEIYRLSQLIIE